MIVRISTEGQYHLDDSHLAELNAIDNQIVALVASGDEGEFSKTIVTLLELVRQHGTPVPDDEIVASDIVLPPSDVTLADARQIFQGDGLIPD